MKRTSINSLLEPAGRSWAAMLLLFGSQALGHAHFLTPAPRNPDPSIKVAPCGPYAKVANPAVTLTTGGTLLVQWQETINHPGKYIFTWLQSNDTPMPGVAPVIIPDNQDSPGMPHNYTTTLTVPNVPCANCGLQLVQSMEEIPTAPSYYYSCVDVRIVAGTTGTASPTPASPTPGSPTPGSADVTNQEATLRYSGEKVVVGSGCGVVKRNNSGGFGGGMGGTVLLFIPFLTYLILRRHQQMQIVKKDSCSSF